MPENPITRAELWHAMEQFEHRVNIQFDRMDRRLDTLQFASKDAFDALARRVHEVEEGKKWLTRFLAAAFLLSFALPLIVAWVLSR